MPWRAVSRLKAGSRAYERTSLIITTNLPFAEWIEVTGKGIHSVKIEYFENAGGELLEIHWQAESSEKVPLF